MKEVISKDPNIELIQLEGEKEAIAELIVKKRSELIINLSNIDEEKEKANNYINEYFGKFKLCGKNVIIDSINNDSLCNIPKTTKWYEDFVKLLNDCKIKSLYYDSFKIIIKAYIASNNHNLVKSVKNQVNDQVMFMKEMFNIKELNSFYKNLIIKIKENCIINGVTKQTAFTDFIMFMIYQGLDNIAEYDIFKNETNVYIDILNSLIKSIATNSPIDRKYIIEIKNLIHYKDDGELLFVDRLKKLSKEYNSSFAVDEGNYTVGKVVKLSSFKEDNKNNSIIYVDEDKGLTALHISAINDFVTKVVKQKLSNEKLENEITSLIAFGDVSSKIMIEEAMEKLRKQNFNHQVNKVLILLSNKLKQMDAKKVMHK